MKVLKLNVVVSDDPEDSTAILSIRDSDETRGETLLEVPTVPILGGSVTGPGSDRCRASGHADIEERPVPIYNVATPVPLSLLEQVWVDQLPSGIEYSPLDAVCGILESDLNTDQQR